MEDLKQLVKIAGPKMIPFLKSVCVYFAFGAHNSHGEYWTTALKCAPIVSLIVFIVLYGNQLPKRSTYAHNILLGLVFSCGGDALLNHGHFAAGMAVFGIAQIFYILAFQTQSLKLWIAGILYSGGIATVFFLRKKLESTILIGLPIYTFLLLTMCWRSIVRACDPKYNTSALPTICALGSLLFVASDSMIAFDKFNAPIPNSTILIMTTYYAAQFAIALSVIDLREHVNVKPKTGQQNAGLTDNGHVANTSGTSIKSAGKNE